MAGVSRHGYMFFSSYRDPNLLESVEVYRRIADFLSNLEITDEEVVKYIIGTVAKEEKPLTASQKGSVAFSRYIIGADIKELQKFKDGILSVTADDFKNFAHIFAKTLTDAPICVLGSDKKIEECKESFDRIETIIS
jgi:Zn-dependent M16 (insulinase) family peptidase